MALATRIVPAGPAAIEDAAAVLAAGGLVAFPTETVYGLGADAASDAAAAKLFAAKGRPRFNPLIVHVADLAAARRLAEFNDDALALAHAFWPGPLTLVLRRSADCPVGMLATAGLDTVALRVPVHPVAHEILVAFGRPVVAPSANRSGCVSPTTAAHVAADLAGRVDLLVDGGACLLGVESTILACLDGVILLRPGAVTRHKVARVVGWHRVDASIDGGAPHAEPANSGNTTSGTPASRDAISREAIPGDAISRRAGRAVVAPGMLASHYAPRAAVRINADTVTPGEALLAFGSAWPVDAGNASVILNLSKRGDLVEAAANLFAHLRRLDELNVGTIAVMPIPEEGLGEAINDRLRRAAAPRVAALQEAAPEDGCMPDGSTATCALGSFAS
jgi:L-threonylcarbamoyladenylate synthase